jgi:hypothetical protein
LGANFFFIAALFSFFISCLCSSCRLFLLEAFSLECLSLGRFESLPFTWTVSGKMSLPFALEASSFGLQFLPFFGV